MNPSDPLNPYPSQAPQPPQQPLQPQAPQPQQPLQPQQPITPVDDPGKTLGIVGFIFIFIPLQLIGLILSIIGYRKSKQAGFKNGLALAGIIANAIITGLALIAIPFFILVSVASYNGISTRANDSTAKSSAATVQKYTELYAVENDTYPTSFTEMQTSSYGETTKTIKTAAISNEPAEPGTVEFSYCEVGNKIGYWDYTNKEVAYLYTGDADKSSDCTIAND